MTAVPVPDDAAPRTVLIAENDPVHRAFIRDTVGTCGLGSIAILDAPDGGAAVALARRHRPGCVVLDLQMPVMSGVEAARAIWAERPQTRILFWSNHADEAYVRALTRMVPQQASYGYVLKSTSRERLKSAITGVFLDEQCIVDRQVRGVQARALDRLDALSDAEYDMLIEIALGLTDLAIAERHGLSTRGVQSRLQRLYGKLGLRLDADAASPFNSRTRAICIALLRGLINPEVIERANRRLQSGGREAPAPPDV